MTDTRNPDFPHTCPWDDPHDHIWKAVESQSGNEVRCVICNCPGDREPMTGNVYWPAT